jgi:2-iminobutanoate/2-iminopropanoate deaminase
MRRTVATGEAPAAIGPYSQAVEAGGLLFCSGQIALDPSSGELVGDGDVEAEARQVLRNLGAVLAAAGLGFNAVLKATIYLTDLEDFGRVNAIYGERFPQAPPARATVQVAALPKGARVEIDLIAMRQE